MKTVLLAINNQSKIPNIKGFLESRGLDVEITQNGNQAIQLAIKLKPVFAILDSSLLNKDAWTVSYEIRTSENMNYLPILGVVPNINEELMSFATQYGMVGLISEDYNLTEIDTFFQKYVKDYVSLNQKPYESDLVSSDQSDINEDINNNTNQINNQNSNSDLTNIENNAESKAINENDSMTDSYIKEDEKKKIFEIIKLSDHLLNLNPVIEPLKEKFGEDGDEFVGYITSSHERVSESLNKLFQEKNSNVSLNDYDINNITENPLRDKKVRHDFRNMIGSSSGFSQLLMTETEDESCVDILSDINKTAMNFVHVLDTFK